MTTESTELLRRYVADRSEPAFAELVRRHVDLVYSAALRQVAGEVPAAQDVTQAVFTDLARQAPRLTRHSSLTGWLYTSTRYLAAKARRTEQRRRAREQEAYAMNQLLQSPNPDPAWTELGPLLDDAMHELGAVDREAVLLRYFESRPLAEIGTRLGLSENAARMRVDRALDKLRAALAKRGVTSTATALAAVLAERAVGAAPAGLAAHVSQAAFAAVAAGGGLVGLLTLAVPTKAQLLVGAGAAVFVAVCLLASQRLSSHGRTSVPAANTAQTEPASASPADAAAVLTNAVSPASADLAATSNKLVLHIVAADVGLPVPSVPIDRRVWQSGRHFDRQLLATRKGLCEVSYPTNLSSIELTTRTEGFADTRLVWEPEHGDAIPQAYTVHLDRAVPIGGSVVDPDGRPVAGATIRFRCRQALDAPGLTTRPQSHDFQECATPTDHEGRWRLERIAEDMLRWTDCVASHPLYASAVIPIANDSNTEKLFRAGQYVFHLGRAPNLSVGGIVTDPSGQPVGGATVTWGLEGETQKRAKSNSKGRFYLGDFDPGPLLISAKAEGFAAVGKNVEVKTDMEPVELRLKPARPLRLCVLSQSGEPIRDAAVWITPGQYFEDQPAAPVLTRIDSRTDAAGRVVLKETPDEEIGLVCAAFGFRRFKMKLRPDDQEHVITMSQSLRVSGTVRNATTSELIPGVWVSLVMPMTNSAGEVRPFWQGRVGNPQHFSNGSYWVTTGDWPPMSGWFLRFEADGYWPAVSRFITEVEGELNLDVPMQPGAMISVVKQDGTPARLAQVGIVASGGCLQLAPFGFDPSGCEPYGGWGSLHTDTVGRFCLPPDGRIQRVFVSDGSGGWAEATPTELAAHPVMQLRAWCMVRGACLANGQPAAGRLITLQWASHDHSELDLQRFTRRTDQGGGFLMFGLPAGRYAIAEARTATVGSPKNGAGLSLAHSLEIQVNPGENVQITLPLGE